MSLTAEELLQMRVRNKCNLKKKKTTTILSGEIQSQQGSGDEGCWHQEEHGQQVKGGVTSSLFSTGETHLKCWVQFWGPIKRHELTGVSPVLKMIQSSTEDALGFGPSEIQREAERTGTVLHGEVKAQGDLINVCKYMIGVGVG